MRQSIFVALLVLPMAAFACKSKTSEEKTAAKKTEEPVEEKDAAECSSGVCTIGGRQWQQMPTGGPMAQREAVGHCASLKLEGDGWRLPTIDELRSLIRGCPATQRSGNCSVRTEECLSFNCRTSSCNGCTFGGGPVEGCYWLTDLGTACELHWSSSISKDFSDLAWFVDFRNASINRADVDGENKLPVRCVR